MENSAFIYIPDISGFTKFVTETEISHSQHIISELLEIIIDGNELDFKVSEVEGDAVLFYNLGDAPTISDVLRQSENMFTKFHKHLAIIKRDSVCQCGACQTSDTLTLKFIGHFGTLKEIAISSFNKILGSDVILAHRLLKNNVANNEYILFTDSYLKTQIEFNSSKLESLDLKENIEEFENFGTVKTQYLTLSHLKKNIFVPIEEDVHKFNTIESKNFITINAPLELVHSALIDDKAKLKWVPGIINVESTDKISRINSKHTCIFNDQEVNIQTIASKRENNILKYAELVKAKSGVSFVVNYFLSEENGGTKLSFLVEPDNTNKNKPIEKQNFFIKLKNKILVYFITKNFKKSIVDFKNYCEQLASKK